MGAIVYRLSETSRHQFITARLFSGVFMAFFFLGALQGIEFEIFWIPYFPVVEWNSLVDRFPNILDLYRAPKILLGVMSVISLLIAFGLARKFLSSVLIYGLACLHHEELFHITPNSLALLFLLLLMMVVPEKESFRLKKHWRFPRGIHQISSALVVFFYVLLVNPFQIADRMMQADGLEQQALLSFELQIVLGLFILTLALKSYRWVFWFASLFLTIFVGWGDAGFMNTWFMYPLLVLAIDPRWFTQKEEQTVGALVFYDGHCGLCHGFVNFLLEVDWQKRVNFSALQSPYAQKMLKEKYSHYLSDLNSVVVLSQDQVAEKSKAVILVFKELGGMWTGMGYLMQMMPLKISDWCYDFVSARRYQWFARHEVCSLPTTEERERFIESAEPIEE